MKLDGETVMPCELPSEVDLGSSCGNRYRWGSTMDSGTPFPASGAKVKHTALAAGFLIILNSVATKLSYILEEQEKFEIPVTKPYPRLMKAISSGRI